MADYLTIGSLLGLLLFGVLWKVSSGKVLYYDSDGDPVSPKSFFSVLWLICLVVLVMNVSRAITAG